MNKIKMYSKIIRKLILLAPISSVFLITITGCAERVIETECTGRIIESALPKLVNPLNAATITMMSEEGYDTLAPVELDGNIIATLCSGEHIKFMVDPGKHHLAIGKYPFKEIIKLEVQPKEKVAYKVVLQCTE